MLPAVGLFHLTGLIDLHMTVSDLLLRPCHKKQEPREPRYEAWQESVAGRVAGQALSTQS